MVSKSLNLLFHPNVGLALSLIFLAPIACIAMIALFFTLTVDLNKFAAFLLLTYSGWLISSELMPRVSGMLLRGLATILVPIMLGLAGTSVSAYSESLEGVWSWFGGPINFISCAVALVTFNAALAFFRQEREDQMQMIEAREITANSLDILIGLAKRGQTIAYGELLEQLGIKTNQFPGQYLHPYLALLTGYCIGVGVPPLTVLVVRKDGQIGDGFMKFFPNVAETRKAVDGHDWKNSPPPPFPRQP